VLVVALDGFGRLVLLGVYRMGITAVQCITAIQALSGLGRFSPAPSQRIVSLPVNWFSGSYCYIHRLSHLLDPFTQTDTKGASMTISHIDLIQNEYCPKKEKNQTKQGLSKRDMRKQAKK